MEFLECNIKIFRLIWRAYDTNYECSQVIQDTHDEGMTNQKVISQVTKDTHDEGVIDQKVIENQDSIMLFVSNVIVVANEKWKNLDHIQ